jgi:hypothetical protein
MNGGSEAWIVRVALMAGSMHDQLATQTLAAASTAGGTARTEYRQLG